MRPLPLADESESEQDGRVTGVTFNGKGSVGLAAGVAAPLAGKTFSWSGRSTTPGSFYIDVTVD